MRSVEPVLARLGSRSALNDFRYFVGRRDTLRELSGGGAGNNFWIYGARRVGKSSIGRKIQYEGQRAGARAQWVDLSDITNDYFDALLERSLRQTPFAGAGDVKERFESLACSATERQPILILYDEMDAVAANLRADDQAFLRRVASENIRFNYLFISRGDPQRLVENVSDARSRLLGICNMVPVGALRERDVKELCRLVATDIECEEVAAMADEIWAVVGGHTIAVTTLLHTVAACLEDGHLAPEEVRGAFARKKEVLNNELRSLWYDLAPATRSALLNEAVRQSEGDNGPLLIDGYVGREGTIIRPRWLMEIGRAAGLVPASDGVGSDVSNFSVAEHLHSLLYSINADLQRRGYTAGFETTSETFRWGCLVRQVRGEEDVAWCVNHLSKVVYEGARHSDRSRWRLPPVVVSSFKQTRGFQELVALRNFLDHDPSLGADDDKANWKFQNEGDVYAAHCGHRSPKSSRDWAKVRDGLVREVTNAMETIAQDVGKLATNSG